MKDDEQDDDLSEASILVSKANMPSAERSISVGS